VKARRAKEAQPMATKKTSGRAGGPASAASRPAPSTKAIHEKLGIKPGNAVWVVDRPAHVPMSLLLGERVEGAEGVPPRVLAAPTDVLVAFAKDRAAVRQLARALADKLEGDPKIWVAYPKGNKTDFNRDVGWEPFDALGLAGVAQVAIDATWSALRFRLGAKRRSR
jgi:hypothetical protein